MTERCIYIEWIEGADDFRIQGSLPKPVSENDADQAAARAYRIPHGLWKG